MTHLMNSQREIPLSTKPLALFPQWLQTKHEQNNAHVKGDGGAAGLFEDEDALRRWTVAGPEVSRLIVEFETRSDADPKSEGKRHDETETVQKRFLEMVENLAKVIKEMGNPFEEDSVDLIVLDSHEIMDSKVSESLRSMKGFGQTQFTNFIERLKTPSKFYEPVHRQCDLN